MATRAKDNEKVSPLNGGRRAIVRARTGEDGGQAKECDVDGNYGREKGDQ